MAMSNYPGGFADGVMIRGIPLTMAHPGKVFWVGNASAAALPGQKAHSNGNKGTFDAPYSTIAYALTQCTASRGDIIMVKPGHSEEVTAAAGIVFSVAGVAIVGLGTGTLRPKIRFTTADTADVDITASNITFVNINFVAAFADVAAAIDVSAVAGLTFKDCYFTEEEANENYVVVIDIATGASDLTFEGCKFLGNDVANDNFINAVALDGLYMRDCFISVKAVQTAAAALIASSGNMVNVDIRDCNFTSFVDGALFIVSGGTANRGVISNCYFSSNDAAGAVTTGFDFTGGHMFECYVAGEPDTYGIIGGGSAYANA
jgi:hypothetical protein